MIRYGLVLRSLGHTRDILIANLIAFFIAIALTYPFIRYFGIIGAALSAVLVFNANALSQLFFSAEKLEITFVKLFPLVTLFKFTCIGGVLFVFISLLQGAIPIKMPRIIFSVTLFSAFYILLCYKTKTFNVFQEELVRKLFSRIKLAVTQ